ncbi:N-acetylmuramidase family protein, partial [Actinobacillus vicugnae]|uniref:N-acetylmuramidase family protein n=1 Tax=Actinobacillus vicugnae TaxID=2573093 RepID=UPI001241F094
CEVFEKYGQQAESDWVKQRASNLEIGLEVGQFSTSKEAYYFHPLGLVGLLSVQNKECFCYAQNLMSSPCDGQGTPVLEEHYELLAKELGVEKEVLKAVAEVESRGEGFINVNGVRKAKILYERHYMYRLLRDEKNYSTEHLTKLVNEDQDIINKRMSEKYGTSLYQYTRLEKAKKIDNYSAIKSCSWGRFQVMGIYYDKGGYVSPSEFERAMHLCDLQQFVYFKNYLKKVAPSIIPAMKSKDWARIARIYNGPDYSKNQYDIKMKSAYNKYIASKIGG